jgi:hypothetical protein
MTMSPSLDERYLQFNSTTSAVFQQFPQIEALRHFIFRQLLISPRPFEWQHAAKQWIRPLVRRQRTQGLRQQYGVLLFLESAREVISEALLPVFHELTCRNQRVGLVSLHGPCELPSPSIRFQFPTTFRVPKWAKQAWAALCEAEPTLAKRTLADWFFTASMDIQGCLSEMDHILEATCPDVVVAASTQLPGGSALIASANLKRISTVLLQHGVLQPLYVPIFAKSMCTWGPSSDMTLMRLGVEPHRLHPLGSPRHDAMYSTDRETARRALLHELSLEEKPTLVFFSNGNDSARNGSAPVECARWLEEVAGKYAGRINVIVRLHPNEDGALYRNCSSLVMTKQHPGLGRLLDGCDCIASLCSTAMLDALLYHKPVWQFCADGWPHLADNWKLGLATRIESAVELAHAVERLLETGGRPCSTNGVLERVFSNHGRATQAVADFLVSEARAGQAAKAPCLSPAAVE